VLGRLHPSRKPGQHGHPGTFAAFAEPGTDVSLQDVQVAFVERPQGLVPAAIRSQPQRLTEVRINRTAPERDRVLGLTGPVPDVATSAARQPARPPDRVGATRLPSKPRHHLSAVLACRTYHVDRVLRQGIQRYTGIGKSHLRRRRVGVHPAIVPTGSVSTHANFPYVPGNIHDGGLSRPPSGSAASARTVLRTLDWPVWIYAGGLVVECEISPPGIVPSEREAAAGRRRARPLIGHERASRLAAVSSCGAWSDSRTAMVSLGAAFSVTWWPARRPRTLRPSGSAEARHSAIRRVRLCQARAGRADATSPRQERARAGRPATPV
jgi:hypothetical protein